MNALDVAGPPLEKFPGLAAAVMVTGPLTLNVAVSETKSPLSACMPGKTKTQTSELGYGPPPKLVSTHFSPGNPAAVVGTLPGLMKIVVFASAGAANISAATPAANV